MKQNPKSTLSKNNLRRLQGWARAVHPADSSERCAAIQQYLAQFDDEASAALIAQGWPQVAEAAERDLPEAFAECQQEAVHQ